MVTSDARKADMPLKKFRTARKEFNYVTCNSCGHIWIPKGAGPLECALIVRVLGGTMPRGDSVG